MNAQAEGFLIQSMKQQIDIGVRMAQAYAAYWRGLSQALTHTPAANAPAAAPRRGGKKART